MTATRAARMGAPFDTVERLTPAAGASVGPRLGPLMSQAERHRHLAERAAQGLPAHLEDPAVAAHVVALLMPETAPTNKAVASVSAATARSEVPHAPATSTGS